MTIQSFAANTVVYPDLQNNRAIPPDEILANGFVPPVKMTDGTTQKGSNFPAQYANYLFNELFARITALEQEINVLKGNDNG